MNEVESEHLSSLSGAGLYSYIANSEHSKPFHDGIEKTIKNSIGDWKNIEMDAVAGKWHRWKHGHDLLDIRGKKEIGHLMTDIFTKDGLPLPAMSKNYLGNGMVKTLESFGVDKPIKWLNMNGFDHFFGAVSILESGHDFSQALSTEQIEFTWETAFDTFGEGTLEIILGLKTFNHVLLTSGITEYAAGYIMLYKDISRENTPILEQVINNLPSMEQIVSAFGFYILLSALKNHVAYLNGKINILEFRNQTLTDVSISLGTFAISKSLITTMAVGSVTGGMLLPLLIGGATSLLLREVFKFVFPKNQILITEIELWEQSLFEYNSPWNKNVLKSNNVWQNDIFNNGNIWQEKIFKN